MIWNQRRQVRKAHDRTDSRCGNYLHASFGNIGNKQITGKQCFPNFLLAVLPLADPRERREKSLKTFVVKDLVCKLFMLVSGLNRTPLFLSTRFRVVQADAPCLHKASPFDSHWLFALFVSPVQLDRYRTPSPNERSLRTFFLYFPARLRPVQFTLGGSVRPLVPAGSCGSPSSLETVLRF
jgi:hypothetical protein